MELGKKKSAFTLAEILITLGIIGIIASITIPSIIDYYSKQQYVESLKKAYSDLTQMFSLYMTDSAVSEIGQTSLFDGVSFSDTSVQDSLDGMIKTYFKVVRACRAGDSTCQVTGYKYLSTSAGTPSTQFPSSRYNFCTLNGMCFSIGLSSTCQPDLAKTGQMKANCGSIFVDVNGNKPPNQFGRDFFNSFRIGQDGQLYAYEGLQYAIFNGGGSAAATYWRNTPSYCGSLNNSDLTGAYGYCVGRILEEGWQMNY